MKYKEEIRTKQLFKLLLPIPRWYSSDKTSSQIQADAREKRNNVKIVKPFLTARELELVDLWEKEN